MSTRAATKTAMDLGWFALISSGLLSIPAAGIICYRHPGIAIPLLYTDRPSSHDLFMVHAWYRASQKGATHLLAFRTARGAAWFYTYDEVMVAMDSDAPFDRLMSRAWMTEDGAHRSIYDHPTVELESFS